MAVTPFQDLPISEEAWDPEGKGLAAIQNEIFGEDGDWDRYQKAHLVFDPDQRETKAGYKLPIARMVGGRLQVIAAQLGRATAALNGARGGVNISDEDRRGAYNHLMRYYEKAGIEEDDRPALLSARIALSFLPSDIPDDDTTPKWVQVAKAGSYRGYRRGADPFELNERVFLEMVKNIRAHPSYRRGPDGWGTADVIPWDFEHASTADPSEGSIPYAGTPAQGWTLDLDVRMDSSGEVSLWALTRWLEPARSYIKDQQYRFASIVFDLNGADEVTNENIGACIYSIALTNLPFIRGMQPLAASALYGQTFQPATTGMDAWNAIKTILGFSTIAHPQAVVQAIGMIDNWIANGNLPAGIPLNEVIGALRSVLSLPPEVAPREVLAKAAAMISQSVKETAQDAGITVTPIVDARTVAGESITVNETGTTTTDETKVIYFNPFTSSGFLQFPSVSAVEAAQKTGGKKMEFVQTLASALGVQSAESAITAAVHDLVELKTKAGEMESEIDGLRGLLKAINCESLDQGIERVAALVKGEAELTELKAEVEKLREIVTEQEKRQAEADVQAVLKNRTWPAELSESLYSLRTSDPDKFAELYPLKEEEVSAEPDAQEVKALTKDLVVRKGAPLDPDTGEAEKKDPADLINLGEYPGINRTERAMNYLKGNRPGADKWTHEELFLAAVRLKKADNVTDTKANA